MRSVTPVVALGLKLCSRHAIAGAAPLSPAPPRSARHLRCALVVEMGRAAAVRAKGKGIADAKRAKLYARFGKQIVAAVKEGGPSENANSKLAAVLQQAKLNSVPRDLIERNIKKASDKSQADFQELTYEAYGLGGVGLVIDILTDNVNRSSASVRSTVTKAGGKMADPGSVVFNFQRRGFVLLSGGEEEAVFAAATDAGAEDVLPRADGEAGWEVVTEVAQYGAVFAALRDAGLPTVAEECGLRMVPLAKVSVADDETFERNLKLIDSLLELDDVDAVVINQADD